MIADSARSRLAASSISEAGCPLEERRHSEADCRRVGRWDDWVERVIIHTPSYLSFDGQPHDGGRERHIRDLARVVLDDWGRQVVVVQKAVRDFETVCPSGLSVIGLRAATSSAGDPWFGWKSRRMAGKGDALLYASAEDAWPFFAENSKGVQHGVWWDGPFPFWKRLANRLRVLRFMRCLRCVLCVDTNFINWLRCQGRTGLELCLKCVYLPNYADTERILADRRRAPSHPLRILYARRFEFKRGPQLFLEAMSLLHERRHAFTAEMYTVGGEAELARQIEDLGLGEAVRVRHETLEGMLGMYEHADLAVVPTIWSEGTSLACVEAICAGVPVVTTPVGGLGNVVCPGFNGAVVAPLPEQIALAVEELSHPETWRRAHEHCLAMRDALSLTAWRRRVCAWLKS